MEIFNKFKLGIWNIGIIEKDIHDIIGGKQEVQIRWLKHKYKDRFFADPFLYNVDKENYYVLVEEFPFYTNKGYISMLTIEKKTMVLLKREKLIEEPFHLSYPFVYKNEIIPEAYRSGKSTVYKFEKNRIIGKYVIADMGLIDQTFLEYEGREWIFFFFFDNPLCGLKIFYRENGGEWQAHVKNPVSTDIKTARPGGHFFRIGEKLYRPAQDSEKLYGHRIRIMEVLKLTPDDYKEKEVAILSSQGNPPYEMGFHTFNVENEFIVVDGYREYHSFFVKPLCLKVPKVMKFIGEKR